MGNRPINRRPWRRKPWSRGTKREARWVDANSVVSDECITGSGAITCDTGLVGGNRSTVRELLVGEIDLEWSDSNEVLHERIVGSIAVVCSSLLPFIAENPITVEAPLVRLGLLTVEEASPEAADLPDLGAISLWDNDHLQRFEWMWLHQTIGDPHYSIDGDSMWRISSVDVPVDVRSRRKLGRADRLILLASFSVTTAGSFYNHNANIWPMLRSVVTTK